MGVPVSLSFFSFFLSFRFFFNVSLPESGASSKSHFCLNVSCADGRGEIHATIRKDRLWWGGWTYTYYNIICIYSIYHLSIYICVCVCVCVCACINHLERQTNDNQNIKNSRKILKNPRSPLDHQVVTSKLRLSMSSPLIPWKWTWISGRCRAWCSSWIRRAKALKSCPAIKAGLLLRCNMK